PFKLQSNLKRHMSSHSEPSFSCKVCDYKGRTRGNLKQHETMTHRSQDEKHECKTCGKCFPVILYLKMHERRVHNKSTKCNYCEKLFSCPSVLRQHYKICNEITKSCKIVK